MSRRRLFAAIALGIGVVALVASGAAAAGISNGLVPGNSKNSSEFVNAAFIDSQGNYLSIQAMSGEMTFRTRTGAAVSENTTTVFIYGFTPTGVFGSGCWTTPSTPFDIRGDHSATLSFDSSAPGVTPCPGQLLSSVSGVGSSMMPISTMDDVNGAVIVSVQWTPAGVAGEDRSTVNMSCQSFRAVSQNDAVQQNSNATATISSFTIQGIDPSTNEPVTVTFAGAYSTNFAFVTTISNNQTVNGPSTGTCGPFGNP